MVERKAIWPGRAALLVILIILVTQGEVIVILTAREVLLAR